MQHVPSHVQNSTRWWQQWLWSMPGKFWWRLRPIVLHLCVCNPRQYGYYVNLSFVYARHWQFRWPGGSTREGRSRRRWQTSPWSRRSFRWMDILLPGNPWSHWCQRRPRTRCQQSLARSCRRHQRKRGREWERWLRGSYWQSEGWPECWLFWLGGCWGRVLRRLWIHDEDE